MQVNFLKKEEVAKIEKTLQEQYRVDFSLQSFSLFSIGNKIFLFSKDIEKIKEEILKIKIFSFGLFFGQFKKNKILLSLEGAQMVGKKAKKNVVLLNENSLRNFLLGFNVLDAKEFRCEPDAFLLLKYRGEIVGLGQKKKNYIENLTLKTKRLSHF
ncbi:MAG: NIP7 pre-PUA domain-containing protein [Minisyncoccales bacterium]